MAELRKAGLIDLKTLKMCENAGQCDSAGLAEFLAENGDEMSVSEMLDKFSKFPGSRRGR